MRLSWFNHFWDECNQACWCSFFVRELLPRVHKTTPDQNYQKNYIHYKTKFGILHTLRQHGPVHYRFCKSTYRIGSSKFCVISQAWMRADCHRNVKFDWGLSDEWALQDLLKTLSLSLKNVDFLPGIEKIVVVKMGAGGGKRRRKGNCSRETAPVRWHKKSGSQAMWRMKHQT